MLPQWRALNGPAADWSGCAVRDRPVISGSMYITRHTIAAQLMLRNQAW